MSGATDTDIFQVFAWGRVLPRMRTRPTYPTMTRRGRDFRRRFATVQPEGNAMASNRVEERILREIDVTTATSTEPMTPRYDHQVVTILDANEVSKTNHPMGTNHENDSTSSDRSTSTQEEVTHTLVATYAEAHESSETMDGLVVDSGRTISSEVSHEASEPSSQSTVLSQLISSFRSQWLDSSSMNV